MSRPEAAGPSLAIIPARGGSKGFFEVYPLKSTSSSTRS